MFQLNFLLNGLSIKVAIQYIQEVFTYVSKLTAWWFKPDYLSFSVFTSSIWVIILVSPTLTSSWVPLPLLLPMATFRTFETEFAGVTYSSLLFLKASSNTFLFSSIFYTWIVYLSSGSQHSRGAERVFIGDGRWPC